MNKQELISNLTGKVCYYQEKLSQSTTYGAREDYRKELDKARIRLDAATNDIGTLVVKREVEYRVYSEIPAWDEFYTILPGTYDVALYEHYAEGLHPNVLARVRVENRSKPALFGGVAVTDGGPSGKGLVEGRIISLDDLNLNSDDFEWVK